MLNNVFEKYKSLVPFLTQLLSTHSCYNSYISKYSLYKMREQAEHPYGETWYVFQKQLPVKIAYPPFTQIVTTRPIQTVM